MTLFVTLAADALMAVLLVATILTSVRLSRRIGGLKADEAALRQTIGDLVVATATAERAITGLRAALDDCDRTLADRLDRAEHSAAELSAHVAAGESVVARIGAIVTNAKATSVNGSSANGAARAGPETAPAPVAKKPEADIAVPPPASNEDRLGAALAAAQAMSERALDRLRARAA